MEWVAGAWSSDCLLPVVTGFVAMQEVSGARGPSAWLALIARRDFRRSGYRYLSRGIDLEGAQFTCFASTIVQIQTYKY